MMMRCVLLLLLLSTFVELQRVEAKAKGSLVPRASALKRRGDGRVLEKKQRERSGEVVAASTAVASDGGMPEGLKLVIGAGGIYAAFLYYGAMQEEVFSFKAEDGSMFKAVWFLQVLEAAANAVIGGLGLKLTGGATEGLPLKIFMMGGTSQVCAKACTSLALASGLSFPVVTLAKSGKMIPVMIGSILLGGSKYTLREYLQVFSIIVGTMMVSLGNKKGGGSSSAAGLAFIGTSLALDGLTGGLQNRLKAESKKRGLKPKPYDFMFWTNLFMTVTALVISLANGEFFTGLDFMAKNPAITSSISKFALCSAIGQSFIFYTISNFDSLVCTTVTTTRKIFSVLLSIFLNGHAMSTQGWAGISVASLGILAEIQNKSGKKH